MRFGCDPVKHKKVKKKKPKSNFFWSISGGTPTKRELWFGDMSEPKPTKYMPLEECFGKHDPKRNKLLLTLNKRLMKMEKKRRGLPGNKLVFVGMANFSKYYYCPWKAYSKSKTEEMSFFGAYLEDRLSLLTLKDYKRIVGKPQVEILKVLDEFSFIDALKSFEKTKMIPSALSSDDIKKKEKEIDAEKDGKVWGKQAQMLYAEKYPTFRWNFRFGDFVLVGVPDGIGDDFVYEFKSTKNSYIMENRLNEARAQADLYGYFFKKPKRLVHAFCIPNEEFVRRLEDVNPKTAEELLEKWTKMAGGELPQPPIRHRCEKCDIKKTCELRNLVKIEEKKDINQRTLADFK